MQLCSRDLKIVRLNVIYIYIYTFLQIKYEANVFRESGRKKARKVTTRLGYSKLLLNSCILHLLYHQQSVLYKIQIK